MNALQRPIIPAVVSQHVEDAAHLRAVRSVLMRAPHVKLLHLGRGDERLAAHLDGVSVAGEPGARMALEALERPGVGEVFVVGVGAILQRDAAQLGKLLALVDAVPDAARGLASAFGWVSASELRGQISPLLLGAQPAQRWLGLVACAQHRVDPGPALAAAIDQADLRLRARALQAAGELGRVDLLPACLSLLRAPEASVQFAAAHAAVLLGDRGDAWAALRVLAQRAGPFQEQALVLALLSADIDAARALVRELPEAGASQRLRLKAAGWCGDAAVVPWLIQHLADDRWARLAGEALSFITGVDLAWSDLERKPPEHVNTGPSEDPDDDNVALDEDDSLPWPDVDKFQAWWSKHAGSFSPGTRCFAGAAPTPAHLHEVLLAHTQRRRFAAALLQCLAEPGRVLFNCMAPTRRQQRVLEIQEV